MSRPTIEEAMQEAEFLQLPIHTYAYCRCGRLDRLSLKRDIYDYINGRQYYTPLYLCSGCHWEMDCEFRQWERFFKQVFDVDIYALDEYLTTQQFSYYVHELDKHRKNDRAHRNAFLITGQHYRKKGEK